MRRALALLALLALPVYGQMAPAAVPFQPTKFAGWKADKATLDSQVPCGAGRTDQTWGARDTGLGWRCDGASYVQVFGGGSSDLTLTCTPPLACAESPADTWTFTVDLSAYALASHTHAAGDVTSGTFAAARLPAATTSARGGVVLATSGEATAGEAVDSTDSRLSDSRTPTSTLAHASTHAQGQSDALSGTLNVTITGTAPALAANGANCSAGSVAGGVDAAGAAESCIDPVTQTEGDARYLGIGATATAATALAADPAGCGAHQFGTDTNTAGALSCAQPAFTDLSGVAALTQLCSGTPASGKYCDGAGTWTTLPSASLPYSVDTRPAGCDTAGNFCDEFNGSISGTWEWGNQGSATDVATDAIGTDDAAVLTAPTLAGNNWRCRWVSPPSGDWVATVRMMSLSTGNYNAAGIFALSGTVATPTKIAGFSEIAASFEEPNYSDYTTLLASPGFGGFNDLIHASLTGPTWCLQIRYVSATKQLTNALSYDCRWDWKVGSTVTFATAPARVGRCASSISSSTPGIGKYWWFRALAGTGTDPGQ